MKNLIFFNRGAKVTRLYVGDVWVGVELEQGGYQKYIDREYWEMLVNADCMRNTVGTKNYLEDNHGPLLEKLPDALFFCSHSDHTIGGHKVGGSFDYIWPTNNIDLERLPNTAVLNYFKKEAKRNRKKPKYMKNGYTYIEMPNLLYNYKLLYKQGSLAESTIHKYVINPDPYEICVETKHLTIGAWFSEDEPRVAILYDEYRNKANIILIGGSWDKRFLKAINDVLTGFWFSRDELYYVIKKLEGFSIPNIEISGGSFISFDNREYILLRGECKVNDIIIERDVRGGIKIINDDQTRNEFFRRASIVSMV